MYIIIFDCEVNLEWANQAGPGHFRARLIFLENKKEIRNVALPRLVKAAAGQKLMNRYVASRQLMATTRPPGQKSLQHAEAGSRFIYHEVGIVFNK